MNPIGKIITLIMRFWFIILIGLIIYFGMYYQASFTGAGYKVGEWTELHYDGYDLTIPIQAGSPREWQVVYLGRDAGAMNNGGLISYLTKQECADIGFKWNSDPIWDTKNTERGCQYSPSKVMTFKQDNSLVCTAQAIYNVQNGGDYSPQIMFDGNEIGWDSGGKSATCKGEIRIHIKEKPVEVQQQTTSSSSTQTTTGSSVNNPSTSSTNEGSQNKAPTGFLDSLSNGIGNFFDGILNFVRRFLQI